MKIRSAVPENGCLVFFAGRKKNKKKQKTEKNICKTYTHPVALLSLYFYRAPSLCD